MLRAAFVDNYSPRKGDKQSMRGRPGDLLAPKKDVLILLRHGESRSIQMLQTRGCGLQMLMSLEARSAFLLPIDHLSRGLNCDGTRWLRVGSLHSAAVECRGINFYSPIMRGSRQRWSRCQHSRQKQRVLEALITHQAVRIQKKGLDGRSWHRRAIDAGSLEKRKSQPT
jgi:hypothetical protein